MAAVTQLTMHNSKRRVLIASLGLAVVSGLVLGLVPEGSPLDWLLNFVIAIGVGVLILAWCHYDSHQHGRGVGSGLRVLIILLGPFALWLYLARTRPLKQALAAIGLSFALVFGLLVLSSAIAAGVALTIGPLA